MWLSGRAIRCGCCRRRCQLGEEQLDGVARQDRIVPAHLAVGPVTLPEFQRDDEGFNFVVAQCFEEHGRSRGT
jgi:hypothetical protein